MKKVFTNGVFDLLHPGHIRFLQFAKDQGDYLIVGVNSDESVRRLKGANRPIIPVEDRVYMVENLKMVDEVHIFHEDDPYNLIKKIKPHYLVKGRPWTPETVIGSDLVKKVIISPDFGSYSTTNLEKKLQLDSGVA